MRWRGWEGGREGGSRDGGLSSPGARGSSFPRLGSKVRSEGRKSNCHWGSNLSAFLWDLQPYRGRLLCTRNPHTRARAVVCAHKHGQWLAYHRSSIMVVYVHARSRHTLRKEETGIGWVVKYRAELNQRLKQDCNTNSRLKQLLSCKKWRRYEPDRSIFHKSWVWESRETSFQLLSLVTRWMFCQIRVKFSTM